MKQSEKEVHLKVKSWGWNRPTSPDQKVLNVCELTGDDSLEDWYKSTTN